MDVVLSNAVLIIGLLVACINLTTAIINHRKQKKKDRRSAKRRSK